MTAFPELIFMFLLQPLVWFTTVWAHEKNFMSLKQVLFTNWLASFGLFIMLGIMLYFQSITIELTMCRTYWEKAPFCKEYARD